MTTQLRINFRSESLEERCKVQQKNLMKYVMNLCQNEENEMSPKNSLLLWQLDKPGTTDLQH